WVGKFDAKGGPIWVNDFPNVNAGIASAVTTDAAGDVIATYDPQTAGTPTSNPEMVKLRGADGSFVWTTPLDPIDSNIVVSDGKLSLDGAGNINYTDRGNVYRVGAGGGQMFARGALEFGAKLFFTGVSTDASGNAFVAGSCESANFGSGAFAGPGSFVVKFAPGGAVDLSFDPYFQAGQVYPIDLHLDADGNVIVAGGFFGDGTTPNFGAGPFNAWGSPDTFVVARTAASGKFVWAKQMSLVTAGGLDALGVSGGKVFLSGGFDASMLLDGYQLINADPVAVAQQNLFIGAFRAPCGTPGCDVIPPVFDPRTIPGLGSAVGRPIIVYATSRIGATVLYTPPTARNAAGDNNYDGVVVNCLPASGSAFPIGVTTVQCSATDPHGNSISTSFPITVLATNGPVLLNVPERIETGATGPNGAVVSYRPPTAADQIDGQVPVTCSPPSGSTFPIGITLVACSATDRAEPPNQTLATFPVEVTLVGQPTITVPNPPPVVDATKATGAIVKYAASAKDAAGRTIPVSCAPASGKLFPLGETKVTCTAKDAAGHQATESFPVLVRFKWSGFLPPIKNDGTSSFTLKSVVPVKFQLPNGIKDAAAHLMIAKVTNGVPGPEQKAVPATSWNTGNLFRYDKSCNAYIFNMATKSLTKGKWRLRVDLHDTVGHTVDITLK
ncbi:MAG: HYR domain-containing protein, partial [Polyangiaceae bacterium]